MGYILGKDIIRAVDKSGKQVWALIDENGDIKKDKNGNIITKKFEDIDV